MPAFQFLRCALAVQFFTEARASRLTTRAILSALMSASDRFIPAQFQPPLPVERFIVAPNQGAESFEVDVVIVGAGPAGLAAAIELARKCRNSSDERLVNAEIAVLEKASSLGGHNLSGAVIHPRALRELFPDLQDSDFPFRRAVKCERVYFLTKNKKWRLPTPPTMRNHGNYVASICELVRWMGEQAEALGVHIMPGYPAASLIMEGDRVAGVRTTATGLERDGSQGDAYVQPTDVKAKITILAEGTRGALAGAYLESQKITSPNPQIYALGVKELWRVKEPLDAVIHTLGWPVPASAFGGSWIYPMADDQVSLGLVIGLDYPQQSLDVHDLVQQFKAHPMMCELLKDGELIEWGAKTIPEGGYYSLPERLVGDGVMIVGDAAGFVDVPSLKGIHYAIHGGMLAGRAAFDSMAFENATAAQLASYDRAIRDSFVVQDLYKRRNMRLAFTSGRIVGGVKAGLMTLTGGKFPGKMIRVNRDADKLREPSEIGRNGLNSTLSVTKLDAVGRADNTTRDSVPMHLIGGDVPEAVGRFYEKMCPAGVYEWKDGRLVMNGPNCVDCKATDILGPRWTPREGGSGPNYKMM